MAVLSGLTLAENLSGRINKRREILQSFPGGAAYLADLISRLPSEETNQVQFNWFEYRLPNRNTALDNISTTVVFCSTSTYAALSANFSLANGDALGINVADYSRLVLGDIIEFTVIDASAVEHVVNMTISVKPSTAGRLVGMVHNLSASITVDHDAAHDGNTVRLIGNARGEGTSVTAGESFFEEPIEPYNNTQIMKLPYDISGTALKSAQDYNGEGAWEILMWQKGLEFMMNQELNLFWGKRHTQTDANGRRMPLFGGLYYYLQQWEAADSIYRGGTGAAAITGDTNFDKRIIANSTGSLSSDNLVEWCERLFNKSNSVNMSKVGYMGSTAARVIHTLLDEKSTFNVTPADGDNNTWGNTYTGYKTPFGDLYFKSHPLFNADATWRKLIFFVDVGFLRWRYMSDRDVRLVTEIQDKRDDTRQDMWIGEGGPEIHYPEAHMLINNVTTPA